MASNWYRNLKQAEGDPFDRWTPERMRDIARQRDEMINNANPEQKAQLERERAWRSNNAKRQGSIPVGARVRYTIGDESYEGYVVTEGKSMAMGEPIYMVSEDPNETIGVPRHQSELEVIQ